MDIPDVNTEDLKNAGELINTAAKSYLGKKVIDSVGNYFGRRSSRKSNQTNISDENAKVIASAEAQVKADLIKFSAELEKGSLLADYIKRSGSRLISEQIRKDFNIDSTVSMAVDQLDQENEDNQTPNEDDKAPSEEPIKEDWFARWTSIVENISEENVQRIWGGILAGEVKSPGSFSLRSLEVIRNLSKTEAETFTKFCSFILVTSSGFKFAFSQNLDGLPIINEVMGVHGIRNLEEAGLVSPGSSSIFGGLQVKLFPGGLANKPTMYKYGNMHINIVPTTDTSEQIQESVITLTQAGNELHNIVSVTVNNQYLYAIKNIYSSKTKDFTMSVHNIISNYKTHYNYNPLGITI